jgi:Ni2+-binding GTPase involved in maturation of urease and hydrogenase
MTQLHLVGGFLGSGKTTAILGAARVLSRAGKKVGILTNDQGKYLVDTSLFRSNGLNTVEVTGGCFCCQFDDLDRRISEILENVQPDVIFAESVGSCTDLVATVIKPMLRLRVDGLAPSSFSVFSDSRLLRLHLQGLEMPFHEDVVYLFEKQLEEAGLVILNKADLLSPDDMQELERLFHRAYPGKICRPQNSLNEADVSSWLDETSTGSYLPGASLQVDYSRYGRGEAELAWLDEDLEIHWTGSDGRALLVEFLERIRTGLAGRAVGHVKFFIEAGGVSRKISLTTVADSNWLADLPAIPGDSIRLLVNGRVQMDAADFHRLVDEIAAQSHLRVTCKGWAAFQPSQPHPRHRDA